MIIREIGYKKEIIMNENKEYFWFTKLEDSMLSINKSIGDKLDTVSPI